jgi:hypothetical protein
VSPAMRFVRYGLPGLICLGGVAALVVEPNRNGLEGGILIVSAGLSVLLLNWLYRVGVAGERERDREDDARAFFDRHGVWPDEISPDQRAALERGPRRDEAPHRTARATHPPRRR